MESKIFASEFFSKKYSVAQPSLRAVSLLTLFLGLLTLRLLGLSIFSTSSVYLQASVKPGSLTVQCPSTPVSPRLNMINQRSLQTLSLNLQ